MASWILDSSKDSVTVSFAYAIPYSRLIFTKSQNSPGSSAGQETFESDLSFSIDAADSAAAINHHMLNRNKIITSDFSVTQDPAHLAEGIITMTLPRSVFKVSAEVRDDNQRLTYLNSVETKRFNASSPPFSIVFADSMKDSRIFPIFIDNVAAFPRPITFAFLMSDTATRAVYLKLETPKGLIIKSDSAIMRRATMEPINSSGTVFFGIEPSTSHELCLGEFKVDSLTEGEYEIVAEVNGKVDKIRFRYLWMNKPFTLRNLEGAISLLKYIVPDSVYSYINSGNDREKKEKFDSYWRSHDPTPGTAYNELEAEYYERADYAFDHFKTITADNGAATDRGKAYILFGKPTSVTREFHSDGTYEIWYYPNHKKELVFKERGVGNFVLYRTEDL